MGAVDRPVLELSVLERTIEHMELVDALLPGLADIPPGQEFAITLAGRLDRAKAWVFADYLNRELFLAWPSRPLTVTGLRPCRIRPDAWKWRKRRRTPCLRTVASHRLNLSQTGKAVVGLRLSRPIPKTGRRLIGIVSRGVATREEKASPRPIQP